MPCQLLSLDVESRGTSPALAPPPRVCGEVYLTLPYLTLPQVDPKDLIGISSFDLHKTLEMDPEFLNTEGET